MNFTNNTNDKKPSLKIITLSGTESVTKNLTVYEYGDDIILVDCGVGFPDSELFGVDVVIPDFTYLIENAHKIRGLLITHGHEDHIGAVPYLIDELDVPIYSGKLVQGFITERLKDKAYKGLAERFKFTLIEPNNPPLQLGVFKIESFFVNHSVPNSMGYSIDTPEGKILHISDFKIDWTPVLDPPIDVKKISSYGDQGVLCLLSDCLNVTTEGFTQTESDLGPTFVELFERAQGKQVLITTISSNISRMFQIIDAALKHNRRIVLSGRSIDQSVSVARNLGYLPFPEDVFVKEEAASSYPQEDLVYIVAGCYGQEGSSLGRLSRGEHNDITLQNGAFVVFSADPNPPGVDVAVEKMMANLTLAGADVLYSKIQQNLHVSGHGTKGDLMTIASMVHPKYFIPIGGTITKMRAYRNALEQVGFKKENVFECLEGDTVEFSEGKAAKGKRLSVKQVYLDGRRTTEINPILIKDRDQLSSDGVFVVIIPQSQDGNIRSDRIDIVTRGFIYVKGSHEQMDNYRRFISKSINKEQSKAKDWMALKRKLEHEIERYLYKETGRSPMVLVHSITI